MTQADIFAGGEGDAYTLRNAVHNSSYDPVTDPVRVAIEAVGLRPTDIVDLGCSTGERLHWLSKDFEAAGIGIDASYDAIEIADNRQDDDCDYFVGTLHSSTAGDLIDGTDLVIMSFVWHWLDRSLIPQVVQNLLMMPEGSHLVIQDFYPDAPIDVPYKHASGVVTFKRRYPDFLQESGNYERIYHHEFPYHGNGETVAVTVLRRT